ncbi:tetratricopeptide repeat protein [Nocardiopsis protaetiae]
MGWRTNAQGRYRLAERSYRRALDLSVFDLGPEHPDTLMSRNNLATVLSEFGSVGGGGASDGVGGTSACVG